MNKIIVRPLSIQDDFKTVSKLIYYTDKWVYPALFDNDVELAMKVIPKMMMLNTVFSYLNIQIACIGNIIVGVMVFMRDYPKSNYQDMKSAFLNTIGKVTPRFEETMDGYFNLLDFSFKGIQILNLSVDNNYQNRHVAQTMIESLSKNETYSLACVKENLPARKLYEKTGFHYLYDYPGFTGIICVELVRYGSEENTNGDIR